MKPTQRSFWHPLSIEELKSMNSEKYLKSYVLPPKSNIRMYLTIWEICANESKTSKKLLTITSTWLKMLSTKVRLMQLRGKISNTTKKTIRKIKSQVHLAQSLRSKPRSHQGLVLLIEPADNLLSPRKTMITMYKVNFRSKLRKIWSRRSYRMTRSYNLIIHKFTRIWRN